jgi:hypothetical protein
MRTCIRSAIYSVIGVAILVTQGASLAAQAPATRTGASYTPQRTPWGDPDLQGTYTNADENGTPMEQPADLAGRRLEEFDDKEMAALRIERQGRAQDRAASIGGTREEDTGAGPSHWYEHLTAANAQPWLVFDPPSGKIPAATAVAQQRAAARRTTRTGRGEADSWEDRSLYDRCISLGVPGSMTPMIYGNAYDITQGPGFVAIRYEMIHETRVIPIGDQPRVASSIRPYMGEARGRWEGSTLVVETQNINPLTAYRGASEKLTITERFTPVDANTLRWEIRFDDPDTWEQSWAYGMPLKRDSEHAPYEYACHEGNRGLANILSAARSEEAEAAAAPK